MSVNAALGEVGGAIALGELMAGEGRRFYGRTTTSATPNKYDMQIRQPLGVAGLIIAANTPIANVAWKVFPALICGNAAVFKAAEDTPATAWFSPRWRTKPASPRSPQRGSGLRRRSRRSPGRRHRRRRGQLHRLDRGRPLIASVPVSGWPRSRSNWAARTRWWCAMMPTSKMPLSGCCSRRSAMPARGAFGQPHIIFDIDRRPIPRHADCSHP